MGFQIEKGILKKYTNDSFFTEEEIPEGVTSIGSRAFQDSYALTRVVIPGSVKSICSRAFSGCSQLTEAVIKNGMYWIGDNAFSWCAKLKTVLLPESVREIDDHAFHFCTSLTDIVIPKGVTRIGEGAFHNCTSIEEAVIPEGVREIGAWAFAGCTSLKRVVLPGSVTSIGAWAFFSCRSLRSVTFARGGNVFTDNSFLGCLSLSELILAGHTLDCTGWNLYEINLQAIEAMLKSKDYYVSVNQDIKYPLVRRLFLKDGQPEAEIFIKENARRFIHYYIDQEDFMTVRALFECGKFVTADNIGELASYAIQHTAKGGNVEIKAYILDYKAKHFPDADPLGGLRL